MHNLSKSAEKTTFIDVECPTNTTTTHLPTCLPVNDATIGNSTLSSDFIADYLVEESTALIVTGIDIDHEVVSHHDE